MNRWLALVSVLVVAACGSDAPSPQTQNLTIVASNYPNYYFAKRLLDGIEGAPRIDLPQIDGDPAAWIPNDDQLRQLQSANLVLINGAGAEKWLDVVTVDEARVRSSTADISHRLITLQHGVRHQHGPEGEHTHAGTAFTTWLDPELATAQAAAIQQALTSLRPAYADATSRNLEILAGELARLDDRLQTAFSGLTSRPILFSQPVYQYLARRYELDGASVHFEPVEVPGARAWVDLLALLKDHPAEIMLWEAEPPPEVAARLAALGVRSVVFEIAANRPASDFFETMSANVRRVEDALSD